MRINNISSYSFKGTYLSNYLEFGKQYEFGKELRDLINSSGMSDRYEREGKDILIDKNGKNGVTIKTVRHDIKRILDDDYSRWNGRF